MKTGRMKGQGFVTLPSEKVAVTAVKETNGLLLKDKPLVVVSFMLDQDVGFKFVFVLFCYV